MEKRAFTSWSLHQPAAQAASACGDRLSGLAPGQRAAFTLVEVLISMVIFAIGFAMVAGVVPAGHLLNRQTEDDVLAAVAGRNAVAVIEAKKIFSPAFEHAMMHGNLAGGAYNGGGSDDVQAAANGGQVWGLEAAFPAVDDFETVLTPVDAPASPATWPASWLGYAGNCPGWPKASSGFRFFADTDQDGNSAAGDATSLPNGRIHAYHRRVGWGDALPVGDLAYPGYTPNPAECPYICTPLAVDLNADPSARRLVAQVAVLHRRSGDEWPERASSRIGDGTDRRLPFPLGLADAVGGLHPNNAFSGFWNTYAVGGNDVNPAMPGLYCLPMIVYDYNANLIQVQYPACWTPAAAGAVDRRLKPGEIFIARESGTVFTVVSARDVAASASLQILEVHPPIRNTLLGPNTPSGNAFWSLRAGFFAPAPSSGGASPLVRVETIPATRGFTSNPNH